MNNSQSTEKRILCVGKVHDSWLEVHTNKTPRLVSEKKILTDKEMAEANEDYREDQADRQWWSRGQW